MTWLDAASQLATGGLVLLVRLYQWTLRPFIGAQCRFEPSCSHYAIEALRRHGPAHGSVLAARRVLRCNPWHAGGHDPVPGSCHSRAGTTVFRLTTSLTDQT